MSTFRLHCLITFERFATWVELAKQRKILKRLSPALKQAVIAKFKRVINRSLSSQTTLDDAACCSMSSNNRQEFKFFIRVCLEKWATQQIILIVSHMQLRVPLQLYRGTASWYFFAPALIPPYAFCLFSARIGSF